MARVIADIHLTPIGHSSTSISPAVAAAHKALEQIEGLEVQLNPMTTTLVGELDTVLAALRVMHEAPFDGGAQRVSTTIRIDDRRDGKPIDMGRRIQAVQEKLK